MKKLNHIDIFLVCLFITIQSFASEPIRVACIGNSITYGAFIPNREMNCYPAQLQAYLGDGYEVKNFGASGRTILSKGDYPYSETDTYKASLEYQPDIVLIKLGTNDTKPQNWKYKNEFKDNYQTLIDTYRNLKSHPRIILLTPIRCFLPEGSGNQCTTDRKRGTPHGGRIGLEKSTGNYQSV
ncbi:GDSL-type esterase/lipase family protein [Bacteroides ovatus]|nr:GDSL-type esterase/lipase family protein [Bacteroides ovatus]